VFSKENKEVYVTRNNYDNRRMIGKVMTSEDKVVKLKLYIAEVGDGEWKEEREFKYNSDEYSVGHPALGTGDSLLYFVSDMPGGFGGTDIYVCERAGGDWLAPKNLGPEINTEGDEMFPWVNEEGVLYFSSDGHGGLGGLDVFRVKSEGGSWVRLKNLGSPINSPQDDFGLIRDREDKSRGYFTSDRTGGQGSDDIYSFKDNGIDLEGIVVDAKTGEPICASTVDLKLNVDVKGRVNTACDGYFEFSVVAEQVYLLKGCAEGYKCNEVGASTVGVSPGETVFVRIPLDREEKVKLEVLVIDRQTRLPIGSSEVVVQGRCDNTEQRGKSDTVGMSYYEARINCDYPVSATAVGYNPGSTEVTTVGVPANSTVKAIVELDKMIDDKPVLLDIYYDFDKWNIRVPESDTELNKLLAFVNANPGTTVEIGSHTDARAPFDYNIRLSQRRAQSVVDWLTARGVSKDRLKAVGYGETRPVNQCTDNVKCTEEEHQLNRRTEFRVIGNNIDITSQRKSNITVDPCKKCPF
jgi:outer membrane protein OmpA-like peptidoglycan-associated protein